MRICLFTPTFFPVIGGTEVFCDIFARGMIARGHEVVVIAQKMKSDRSLWELPYPVRLYKRPPMQHLLAGLLSRPLEKAWKQCHFDVVVMNYSYPLAYAVARVKRRLKLGLITVAHGSDLYPTFNKKKRASVDRLRRLGYQNADHVVAVSDTMAERVRVVMGDKPAPVDVIHNGIDLQAWKRDLDEARPRTDGVAAECGLRPGGFTLQVAGLRPVKRPDLAIAAVAKCREIYDRLNLKHVMAGEGKTGEKYVALAKELGISDRIVFAGIRMGRDKHWLFANALFQLHTSDEEGLPIVLLEGAASGLPMLLSDIMPHVIFRGDSQGVRTFEKGNLEDLSRQLARMLEGEDLAAMRAASLARARAFGSDKMLDAYEDVCRRVITLVQSQTS